MRIIFVALIVLVLLVSVLYILQGNRRIEYNDGLAGWRSSISGYQQEQGPEYWIGAANNVSSKFSGYGPAGIWIIGTRERSDVCNLQFPNSGRFDYITFSETDMNEKYLDAFDKAGLKIWLQVEPGNADVETLIDLVLSRYARHTSVIGFGVDVEWLQSLQFKDGRPVTSDEATRWLYKVKSFNNDYKLFLKHWDVEKMPETYPDDVVFISDSQEFDSYAEMLEDYQEWGKHFSDAEVGFQYGYESDRHLWEYFDDPVDKIGEYIIERVPNCRGLYWVDFTIEDVIIP